MRSSAIAESLPASASSCFPRNSVASTPEGESRAIRSSTGSTSPTNASIVRTSSPRLLSATFQAATARTSAVMRRRCSSASALRGTSGATSRSRRSNAREASRASAGTRRRSPSSIHRAAPMAVRRSSAAPSESELLLQRRQHAALGRPRVLQPPQQALDSAHRDLRAEVIGRHVLQMMRLVDDDPRRGRQHAARRVVRQQRAKL